MMAYQTARAARQEPYTQFPNRYNDVIKLLLTDMQKAVIDTVIRLTYGWHRTSARISTSAFISRTGKSERALINAKRALVDMGLLVILERGGGSRTTVYALDLYYNTDKSVRESLRRQQDSTHTYEEVAEPLDALDTTTVATPDIEVVPLDQPQVISPNEPTNEYDQPTDDTIEDTYTEEPILESEVGVVELTTEVEAAPVSNQVPSTPQMSDTTVVLDVVSGDSCPTPASNAPPLLVKDPNIINKTHTENTEATREDTGTGRRHAVGAVRSDFNKLFPEASSDDDWGYYGWAVSTYGLDVCLDKLKLLGEYKKQHPIRNPYGLFRTALVRDYRPPEHVVAKLKGDERARLAAEHSRMRAAEWDATVSNFSYESATASLQKLLDTLDD